MGYGSSLNVSRLGMEAADSLVKTISHNIANSGSKSFKSDVAHFSDLRYQNAGYAGTPVGESSSNTVPVGVQFGTGVKLSSVTKNFAPGSLEQSASKLDAAIDGVGMFVIDMPDGSIAYTRDAQFHIDPSTLQLVTSQGYPASPGITIPEDYSDIMIKKDGTVWIKVAGDNTLQQVGRFDVASFINMPGLTPIGEGIYYESDASGAPRLGNPGENGFGSLMQGYIETSNVNPMKEVMDLIQAQRAYEMNVKSLEAGANMLRTLSTSSAA